MFYDIFFNEFYLGSAPGEDWHDALMMFLHRNPIFANRWELEPQCFYVTKWRPQ